MHRLSAITLAACLMAIFGACGEEKEDSPFELPPSGGRTIGDDTDPNGPDNSDVNLLGGDGSEAADGRCMPADIFGGRSPNVGQPSANCGDTFSGQGLYKAGVRTIELDGKPVELWYPIRETTTAGREKAVYDMRAWLPQDLAQRIPDTACTRLVHAFQNQTTRSVTPSMCV